MSALLPPRITAADIDLELAIDNEITCCLEASAAGDRGECAASLERAMDLHRQRTPQMVAYLEVKRGLRR